jgi:fructokinase
MSILCLGELLVDMVSPRADASLGEAESFVKAPGGAPANVAVGVARLGARSGFVGCVGADPFGEWLRDVLQRENVNVEHLKSTSDARTSIAFVATRRDGKKDICFYRNPGADAQLKIGDLPDAAFVDAQIFHCGSVSLSMEPCRSAQIDAVKRARDAGLVISFDPNWRPSLWDDVDEARKLIWEIVALSDVVKIADEEWEIVTGTPDLDEGLNRVLDAGPRLVVVTRGCEGVLYATDKFHGEVAAHRVEVVDTLGAGDAFVAGLLSQIARAESFDSFVDNEAALADSIRFANACGAFATQKTGAIPALPTRIEVESWLTKTTN